jgi:hypothetical protein
MTTLARKLGTSALTFGMAIGIMTIPAFADDCSDAIAMVTNAAEAGGLTEADAAAVNAAIVEATDKQTAGDGEGCLASLASAKQMLNLE